MKSGFDFHQGRGYPHHYVQTGSSAYTASYPTSVFLRGKAPRAFR